MRGLPSDSDLVRLTARLLLLGENAHTLARQVSSEDTRLKQLQPPPGGRDAVVRPPNLNIVQHADLLVKNRLPYLSMSHMVIRLQKMSTSKQEQAETDMILTGKVNTFWNHAGAREGLWHSVVRRTTMCALIDSIGRGDVHSANRILVQTTRSYGEAKGTNWTSMYKLASDHVLIGTLVDTYLSILGKSNSKVQQGTAVRR